MVLEKAEKLEILFANICWIIKKGHKYQSYVIYTSLIIDNYNIILFCYNILIIILCVNNLQLDSESKTGRNIIIQVLTKNLRILNVVTRNKGRSKQGGFL